MSSGSQTIKINTYILGPIENNTFLVSDSIGHEAIVIDPSFNIKPVLDQIKYQKLRMKYILLTHAHFDHIAGVNELQKAFPHKPMVALHPSDLDLWRDRGEALACGYQMDPLPDPDHFLKDNEILSIGDIHIDVLYTPGHSPGHVVFSIPEVQAIICGDVIFAGSIGRTDLTGGDHAQLLKSISSKIMCFPDDTRLLPGHGPETTVGYERHNNPYLI
jgi:hydroxyacylglutathione hydrolase